MQRRGAADLGGFLSVVRHVEGDPALSLRFVEDFVHDVHEHHVFVHFLKGFFSEVRFFRRVEDAPFAVHHPVYGDGGVVGGGGEG